MHLLPAKFETGSAVAAIIMAMISVTAGASIAKSMFSTLTPENVTVLRLMVSAAILFFAMRAWEVRFCFRSLFVVFVYGATVAGMNLFFYLAIKTVPVGVALAIELIGPLCVATFFSQSRSDYVWGLLAALGIYLLLPSSSQMSDLDVTGLLYALVAAFFWGAYILVGKKAASYFGRKTPALGLIVASLLVLPVGDYTVMLVSLSAEVTLLVITIALLSSAIPLSLEIFSLRILRTNTYGVLTSGEPVIGAMVSFIILGEQLTIIQCFGVGAIVIASAGTVLSPYSRRQALEASQ